MSEEHTIPIDATPIHDISHLKPTKALSRRQVESLEAANNQKALEKYLKRRNPSAVWTNAADLKRLHHDMFCDVWRWAGRYRKSQTSIGLKPYLITQEVAKLCEDISAWDLSILEQAARIHHRLVWIHPFENGNGRHARLVGDLFLSFHQHPLPRWPTDIAATGSKRARYIETLRAADGGNLGPLIRYLEKLSSPRR